MLTTEQLANILRHTKLTAITKKVGVSLYYLRMIRSGSQSVPYDKIKRVSDYFMNSETTGDK